MAMQYSEIKDELAFYVGDVEFAGMSPRFQSVIINVIREAVAYCNQRLSGDDRIKVLSFITTPPVAVVATGLAGASTLNVTSGASVTHKYQLIKLGDYMYEITDVSGTTYTINGTLDAAYTSVSTYVYFFRYFFTVGIQEVHYAKMAPSTDLLVLSAISIANYAERSGSSPEAVALSAVQYNNKRAIVVYPPSGDTKEKIDVVVTIEIVQLSLSTDTISPVDIENTVINYAKMLLEEAGIAERQEGNAAYNRFFRSMQAYNIQCSRTHAKDDRSQEDIVQSIIRKLKTWE